MSHLCHTSRQVQPRHTRLYLFLIHDDPSTTIGVLPHRQWPIL